jgi:hypothetical protein
MHKKILLGWGKNGLAYISWVLSILCVQVVGGDLVVSLDSNILYSRFKCFTVVNQFSGNIHISILQWEKKETKKQGREDQSINFLRCLPTVSVI